jgi:hypothetical protein
VSIVFRDEELPAEATVFNRAPKRARRATDAEELEMSFTEGRKRDLPPIHEAGAADSDDERPDQRAPDRQSGASESERLLARMDDRFGQLSGDVREMRGFIQNQRKAFTKTEAGIRHQSVEMTRAFREAVAEIEAMHQSTLTALASVQRVMVAPYLPRPVVAPPPYAITMGAYDGARARARPHRRRR